LALKFVFQLPCQLKVLKKRRFKDAYFEGAKIEERL
jgi:hypothetical protein